MGRAAARRLRVPAVTVTMRGVTPGTLDPAFAAIKRRIVERTGHHYYEDKDDILFERVRRRVTEARAGGFEAYLHRLDDPVDGPAEWAALVSAVTIGETYFFRFAEQFAALQAVILPDVIARNRTRRRIRIWSAGCSTGAEPYSVAILVHEALGAALPDWTVTIVGTDIDETALDQARSAVFGRWALRSLGAEERDRWFDPGPAQNSFRLRRPFASLVRFQRANLVDFADGAAPLQFSDFDIVLCRNVLIYFDPGRVSGIVAALGRALGPDGWLLLGHAESHPAHTEALRAVDLVGATAFRPAPHGEAPSPPGPLEAVAAPTPAATVRPVDDRKTPPRRPAAAPRRAAAPAGPERGAGPVLAGAGPADPAAAIAAVREAADKGAFDEAMTACRVLAAAHPLSPLVHFYEGVVARAAGHVEEALAALRRALYLDRGFILAHYHAGLAMRDAGRAGWRRPVSIAGRLAAALAPEAPVAEGDGIRAGEFVRIVRFLLERDGDAT